jgi:enoyl-CoA hydratase/carnithine racemase
MSSAIRIGAEGAVRRLTFCRAKEYNTITPGFRDELSAALDEAEDDDAVRVVLLDAEGPAFCAGYGLDWSARSGVTAEDDPGRVWDSVADLREIGRYAKTWARLHELAKPTIAAVSGWCIAGGTNIVFNADIIIAAESARFGYPPSRVWGVPEAPWTWVARLGLERTRRYMLTGDEFTGAQAAAWGAVQECVADDALAEHATALAKRMAQVPLNQLQMIKLNLNEVARQMYDPAGSRLLGTLFDGVARHTPEGLDFVKRCEDAGFREAVRERDRPFGDYGERSVDGRKDK